MMKKTVAAHFIFFLLCFAPAVCFAGSIPDIAEDVAVELDSVLAGRLGHSETPVKGLRMVVTTPVSLDDFETGCSLARLFAEEMTTWFVQAGYRVQEIRRGRELLFAPKKGELMLTREPKLLHDRMEETELILLGTYSSTSRSVRFTMKLMEAGSGEIIAQAGRALPMDDEIVELMGHSTPNHMASVRPGVFNSIGDFLSK
jgi:hypothetical protein